jgi:hypothetical protein
MGFKGNTEAHTWDDILIFPESTPTLADISMTDKPAGPAALRSSGMWDASKKRKHEGRWYFFKGVPISEEEGNKGTYDHGGIAYGEKR